MSKYVYHDEDDACLKTLQICYVGGAKWLIQRGLRGPWPPKPKMLYKFKDVFAYLQKFCSLRSQHSLFCTFTAVSFTLKMSPVIATASRVRLGLSVTIILAPIILVALQTA